MNPSLYTRPDKPLRMTVKRRTEPAARKAVEIKAPLVVDKFTECHVTPPAICDRMVNYLTAEKLAAILEPSAGTGNLCKALMRAGFDENQITAVERHNTLAASLPCGLGAIYNACFLTWAESRIAGGVTYDAVIMNPPFRAVKKHIAAAVDLLADGGTLIALVPITFKHERAETIEELPVDTFSTCRVYTKIIEIRG